MLMLLLCMVICMGGGKRFGPIEAIMMLYMSPFCVDYVYLMLSLL